MTTEFVEMYNEACDKIHEEVTLGLTAEAKEQYELFCKFYDLYDNEQRLRRWKWDSLLEKQYSEKRESLGDIDDGA